MYVRSIIFKQMRAFCISLYLKLIILDKCTDDFQSQSIRISSARIIALVHFALSSPLYISHQNTVFYHCIVPRMYKCLIKRDTHKLQSDVTHVTFLYILNQNIVMQSHRSLPFPLRRPPPHSWSFLPCLSSMSFPNPKFEQIYFLDTATFLNAKVLK